MNIGSVRSAETNLAQPDPSGDCSREDINTTAQSLDGTVWLDLTLLNRTALNSVLAQHELPPEVTTYFLLRYPSPKLIHAGSALFLVTFLAIPSVRHLFTTRELKICVTPTLVATVCGSSGRARSEAERMLTLPLGLRAESSGRFLCRLFEGVLSSYEDIVQMLPSQGRSGMSGEEHRRWRGRVERFVRFLRDQRIFLSVLLREGGKILPPEESVILQQLEHRVDRLARAAWEAAQTEPERS